MKETQREIRAELKNLLKINSSVGMTTTNAKGTHKMTFEELQEWNYSDLLDLIRLLGFEDMYQKYR